MEFKGTKGKWGVNVFIRGNSPYFVIGTENSRVCNINSKRIELFKEEEANALLISKAPEMLEMLKDIVEQENISQSAHDAIYELINSATKLKEEE